MFEEVAQQFLAAQKNFGVYVHIPFCSKRCAYCAFATWANRASSMDVYVDRLLDEITSMSYPTATSVFIGGGTPSLLPADKLRRILDAIPRVSTAEVTIECNPESIDEAFLESITTLGINRVSIGVQSLDDLVLQELGRQHSARCISRVLRMVRDAGIARVNCDLIFGARSETVSSWQRTIEGLLTFDGAPTHVSAYALTIEEGTPFARDVRHHPVEDDLADKYELADDLFASAGMFNYEISNWARPDETCRHNLLYWAQGNYAGFGTAAHGHTDGLRVWNTNDLDAYLAGKTHGGSERLDDATRDFERQELALRTCIGVERDALTPIARSELHDLLTEVENRLVLTRRGRLLANECAMKLRSAAYISSNAATE